VMLAAPLITAVYTLGNHRVTTADRDLITLLAYLLLPEIFFYGLAGIFAAILNVRGHFAAPMWTPILNNLVVIATGGLYLAIFGATPITGAGQVSPARILVLGGGVLLGIIVQAGGLLPALRRAGFRWRWRFDFRELGLRHLARVGGWMFCYVIVNQLALMVLTNLLNRAGRKDAAGPMIFNNVFLLMMMAHGIVVVSIITALLPRMSHAAADGKAAEIAADLGRGIRMCLVVLTPIAICYAVLALPISITLFERGAIGRDDSLATAPVLAMAGVALVPFAISQLFNFTYYSMQDTKTPALINFPVASLRVSVQLAWFAAFSAGLVAAGMMIGNAVSYVVGAIFSAILLRRRIGLLGLSSIAGTLGKVLVASVVAGAAGFGAVELVYGGVPREKITHATSWLALIIGGLVICGVYGALTMLLRVREVQAVLGMVRRRLGR
jgi:putative peptidoglycan lipid II flippase